MHEDENSIRASYEVLPSGASTTKRRKKAALTSSMPPPSSPIVNANRLPQIPNPVIQDFVDGGSKMPALPRTPVSVSPSKLNSGPPAPSMATLVKQVSELITVRLVRHPLDREKMTL